MTCRHELRQPDGIIKLVWHPTEPHVVTVSVDGSVWVWDARTGTVLSVFTGATDVLMDVALAVTPAHTAVVTGGDDHIVRVFNAASAPVGK